MNQSRHRIVLATCLAIAAPLTVPAAATAAPRQLNPPTITADGFGPGPKHKKVGDTAEFTIAKGTRGRPDAYIWSLNGGPEHTEHAGGLNPRVEFTITLTKAGQNTMVAWTVHGSGRSPRSKPFKFVVHRR
ncbi:hypothetical protein GCM10010123_40350 [Pilimelia anulata]|uniref:PKD domain-containing protein n=1 Tax=Pilimelia anulata TaxID=53371 RepID=A0A8J3BB69_9ACTN|nr:hypothetical protein [Pilimelia anulata]GGK06453.1 hypothetical protein GCM10010123_40350 [Pilimelia anulata]